MKDVEGFEGLYAITEDGRVWSYPKRIKYKSSEYTRNWKGRFLKPALGRDGYLLVSLSKTKSTTLRIHRLVAKTYIPNPRMLPQVNHKNGIKTDNRLENLEWVTSQENVIHAVQHNLKAKGADNWNAILDEEKVRKIRALVLEGVSKEEIGRVFGVARTTVWHIVHRETWAHLDP